MSDGNRAHNVYTLRATALCPVDGLRDHYDVEIRSDHQIKVETIRAFFDDRANISAFQEDLAWAAAEAFKAEVRITGDHPSPIRIESGGSS